MPLIPIWNSNPDQLAKMTIDQIVHIAGDGKLRDDSECSKELREYFSQIPSEQLFRYADQCLTESMTKGGQVLQDLVNELGRRLEFTVEHGRYQGSTSQIGHDGIWRIPDGKDIVVEVKTTDAYRIALDTVAGYRNRLRDQHVVRSDASILMVVGREDTGELEAQVRGSRHAWDMRLISIDALVKLVKLKESTEEAVSSSKLRDVLIPMEFTRLDALVELMFTTAKDVEVSVDIEKSTAPDLVPGEPSETSGWEFTDSALIKLKREDILEALSARDGEKLIKRSTAQYWNGSHTYRVACTISKRYLRKPKTPYWYGYHPTWDEFLSKGETAFVVLGCMDLNRAFVVPYRQIHEHLPELYFTPPKEGKTGYHHLNVLEPRSGEYFLELPRSGNHIPLKVYSLECPVK